MKFGRNHPAEILAKLSHSQISFFKWATGLKFTECLGWGRVERAKSLLLNPNCRVSEVAYKVGFGSLTHFNRVFRDVAD